MTKRRIYLDNAATSWPKPESVYDAVNRTMRELGAAVGRSTYDEAVAVSEGVEAARRDVAALLGAEHPRQVVFTFNGTDSLNLAIHGLLERGDHVVTTFAEHNSVLRPLRDAQRRGLITVSRVDCDENGVVDPDAVRAALRNNTKLVAITHASNVTGTLQSVSQISRIVRERDVRLLLDAAQTVGHMPVNVQDLGVDLLAAPGHKGLLGPLGTGVLYVRPGIEQELRPLRQGGTGSRSEEDRQPELLPDKYESGNHNAPGILGLGAGVDYLMDRGLDEIRRDALRLTRCLIDGLSTIRGVTMYGPQDAERRVEVVSINLRGYDAHEVASMLETGYRIQVRAGIHCAPLMHRALGTLESGGTVRFSLGPFSGEQDVDVTITAVAEIAEARLPV